MIKVKKEKYYPDMCGSCASKENVWILEVRQNNMNYCTQVSICENCLRELKKEIENMLEE